VGRGRGLERGKTVKIKVEDDSFLKDKAGARKAT